VPALAYVCRATWFFSDSTSFTASRLEATYDLVLEGHTLAAERSLTLVGHRFVFIHVTPSAPHF
jgi:hypothetical protein